MKYGGTTFDVVIAFDPEDTASLDAWFWIHDVHQRRSDGSPMAFPVSELLRRRKPELIIPASGRIGLDEMAVRETLRIWSSGLLDLAPDVLRGAWPAELDDVRPAGMPGQ